MEAKFFNGIRDEDEYQNRRRSEHLSYANLLAFTEFINKVANLYASLNPSTISSVKFESFCFAEIVFNFLFVYKHISRWMKNEEKNKLEDYYSHFIQKLFPEGTTTVLHVAVKGIKTNSYTLKIEGGGIEFGIRNKLSTFHSMIKLILKLGADPNAKDEIGRTPLHILAGMKQVHLNDRLPIFQTLVNAGSYLHMADNKGETVLDILKKLLMRYSLKVDPYFESLISNVFPLTCYCARVIRRHRIPFEDRLPRVLRELVSR
jgi:ankyrin repeat protein